MPKVIAVTGGIGAGKSIVCKLLRGRGYPVIQADVLAHAALAEPSVTEALRARHGDGIFSPNGIDRAKLRQIVFSHPEERVFLESLTHPLVATWFAERAAGLAAIDPCAWLFYEHPLLFQKGDEHRFDAILVIEASEDTRIARLQTYRGLARDEANAILAAQRVQKPGSAEDRIRRLTNDGTLDALATELDFALRWLTAKFADSDL